VLLESILSMLLAALSSIIAVGIIYYLVTKDFFLPTSLRLARRLPLTNVWAATWVLAVIGSMLAVLSIVAERLVPWITMTSSVSQTKAWNLASMWASMSTLPRVVVGILLIFSIYSFGVMIDRTLMYSAARKQSLFVQQVASALTDGKLDEAIAIAERNKKSHIAKVVATGLSEFQSAPQQVSESDVVEAAKRGLERSIGIVHADMQRRLPVLAIIGSTAPFVGLFGTVVGILNVFKGIETSKATGLSAVAGGIAEALVTTALGLLVAVPAVWAYNYFTNRVEAFDVEMDNSSMELINYFILRRGAKK